MALFSTNYFFKIDLSRKGFPQGLRPTVWSRASDDVEMEN
jgi:hypothetical protein